MRKLLITVAAVAALSLPATAAYAKAGPDPDHNGDVHSNCHTGAKFRGAGGEDRPKNEGRGDPHAGCPTAPVTPTPTPTAAAPVTPAAPAAPSAASAAAGARVTVVAPAAAPVVAAPKTTG